MNSVSSWAWLWSNTPPLWQRQWPSEHQTESSLCVHLWIWNIIQYVLSLPWNCLLIQFAVFSLSVLQTAFTTPVLTSHEEKKTQEKCHLGKLWRLWSRFGWDCYAGLAGRALLRGSKVHEFTCQNTEIRAAKIKTETPNLFIYKTLMVSF